MIYHLVRHLNVGISILWSNQRTNVMDNSHFGKWEVLYIILRGCYRRTGLLNRTVRVQGSSGGIPGVYVVQNRSGWGNRMGRGWTKGHKSCTFHGPRNLEYDLLIDWIGKP